MVCLSFYSKCLWLQMDLDVLSIPRIEKPKLWTNRCVLQSVSWQERTHECGGVLRTKLYWLWGIYSRNMLDLSNNRIPHMLSSGTLWAIASKLTIDSELAQQFYRYIVLSWSLFSVFCNHIWYEQIIKNKSWCRQVFPGYALVCKLVFGIFYQGGSGKCILGKHWTCFVTVYNSILAPDGELISFQVRIY